MDIDYDKLAEKIIEKQNKNKKPFTIICKCGSQNIHINHCWDGVELICDDCGNSWDGYSY